MTTIETNDLQAVTGGYKIIERRATPEQMQQFKSCVERADGISRAKPWTWGRKTQRECFGDLLKGIQSNPGRVVDEQVA